MAQADGTLAQVADFFPEDGQYSITTVNGECLKVSANELREAGNLGRPGQGGKEDSFDVLIGPRLDPEVLGEEISSCIAEKGFCVLKICQDAQAVARAVDCMRDLAQDAKLSRLPEEVEPGYLGTGNRGKVIWMEDGNPNAPKDPTLKANDVFLSRLVFGIMKDPTNALGKDVQARTPALVSLSLLPGEEGEYPFPFSDSQLLGTFLKTWRRSVLKAVHFMGPGTATVSLEKSGDVRLPVEQESVQIAAGPNTIVLFRTACFDYVCDVRGESLSITTTFMEADVKLTPMTSSLNGVDLASLTDLPGVKPPAADCIHVVNTSTRLAAGMDRSEIYDYGLTNGIDVAVEIPISRFDLNMYYHPPEEFATLMPGKTIFKHMAFVDGLEFFDNTYFNIPKQEAIGMDPMHKHLLETGAMNMYKLGITKKYADRNPHHAGCVVGMDKDDFIQTPVDFAVSAAGGQNVQAIIANRFSYIFNMKGASFVADTACSSSLSGTHLASVMLANRKTDKLDFFICTGLHQCLVPGPWVGMSFNHMNSTIGRCLTFDEAADGYMRGDGCSALTLRWACEEREAIWRGSMVCQNGRSATLTAPNGLAQEDVIWKAIREADSSPSETTVWSCHGTGTSLGDPIEIGAVRKVNLQDPRPTPLMVNTNKPNCGHYEGGAAMTSLVAAVFQVSNQKANPLCHTRCLNPHMEASTFEAFFNTELGTTQLHQTHMHISSFGFGGTNTSAVMWGENRSMISDPTKFWRSKLSKMSAPEIRAYGSDPSEWESDLPDQVTKPGDVWSVTVEKGAPPGAPMKWEKTEEGIGDEYDLDDISYSIIGSFNEWTPQLLEDGDVPGLRSILVEVPYSGIVKFRFVQTVDEEMVLAPASDNCSKKTAQIVGPSQGLTNSWQARGAAGSFLHISLFTSYGRKAISWKPSTVGLD